jgi:hypothetical protein
MPTFKFWSDTSLHNCKIDMDRMRLPYEADDTTMTVAADHAAVPLEHGASELTPDDARLAPDDGFQDIGAFSARARPTTPSIQQTIAEITRTIRGPDQPEKTPQTPRRRTRGQP